MYRIPFPRVARVQFRSSFVVAATALAGADYVAQMKLNSLFDPLGGLGAANPANFSRLLAASGAYTDYRVDYYAVTIKATNVIATANGCQAYLAVHDIATQADTAGEIKLDPYAKRLELGYPASSKSFGQLQLRGYTKAQQLGALDTANTRGTYASDPTDLIFATLVITDGASAAALRVELIIDIVQYATLMNIEPTV